MFKTYELLKLSSRLRRSCGPLIFCFFGSVAILGLSSCASYQKKVQKARTALGQRNYETALDTLKAPASEEGKDQLVYLFDYASALQMAGKYKESNKIFEVANKMVEIKDYHSISKITGSILLNEGMMQYKGDDYEKVMINAQLAINYTMLGDVEGALVEVRRLNEKLYKYKYEAKKNYEQNSFAFYLSALLWEEDRKWDDAYIDYKRAYERNPDLEYLKEDLVRAAYRSLRYEEGKKWSAQFNMPFKKEWKSKNWGEVVLIYQQGWGPRKQYHPDWHSIPKLFPKYSYTTRAKLVIDGNKVQLEEISQSVYNLEAVAIKTLDDAYAGLVAKRVAGVVAKEIVSDQLRQKNQLLGNLLQLGMHISDRADLRQWSTLPATFQIARIRLKPGTYHVGVQGLNRSGVATGESMSSHEVKVARGKKTFLSWRSFN